MSETREGIPQLERSGEPFEKPESPEGGRLESLSGKTREPVGRNVPEVPLPPISQNTQGESRPSPLESVFSLTGLAARAEILEVAGRESELGKPEEVEKALLELMRSKIETKQK